MVNTDYKLTIEELTTIRNEIDSRIKTLREENGVDLSDIFEAVLEKTLEELQTIINDRNDNDDDPSLWKILFELRRLESNVLRYLRGSDGK